MGKEMHHGLLTRLPLFSHYARQSAQSFSVWSSQWSDEHQPPTGADSIMRQIATKDSAGCLLLVVRERVLFSRGLMSSGNRPRFLTR